MVSEGARDGRGGREGAHCSMYSTSSISYTFVIQHKVIFNIHVSSLKYDIRKRVMMICKLVRTENFEVCMNPLPVCLSVVQLIPSYLIRIFAKNSTRVQASSGSRPTLLQDGRQHYDLEKRGG